MTPDFLFIFDVESIGLHGEGFAVAGGVYRTENAAAQSEFRFCCDPAEAKGFELDRDWVNKNVPIMELTHRLPELVRNAFWQEWEKAKTQYPGITMAAECLWPVEANFVIACVNDAPDRRNWGGPYPFQEIASFLTAVGMDPMAIYDRTPSELPKHDPLADARQSARLLSIAISKLKP